MVKKRRMVSVSRGFAIDAIRFHHTGGELQSFSPLAWKSQEQRAQKNSRTSKVGKEPLTEFAIEFVCQILMRQDAAAPAELQLLQSS